MKTLGFFVIFILLTRPLNAQVAALKMSGLLLGKEATLAMYDVGAEVYFKNRWGLQLSYAKVLRTTESKYRNKEVFTPQLRYYTRKATTLTSPYLGFLIQYHRENTSKAEYDFSVNPSGFINREYRNFNKIGFGFVGGVQIKMFKRFGFDVNVGAVAQKGEEVQTLYLANSSSVQITTENSIKLRPFWTFNFYLALGKIVKPEISRVE